MAIVANTQTSYITVGNREDLADFIDRITPDETPLYSMIGDEKISATKTEWQTDSLATPSTSNAVVEGDTFSYSALTATSRVGNYAQIFRKSFIVTNTQEAVDQAGRKSYVAYEKAKKGLEIRSDMEVTFAANQASVAGNGTTARQLGGLRAWLATNDSMGSSGASGGYNSGTGVVDAATDGTKRAFSKTLLDDTIETTYKAGGSPDVLMVSPYVKRVFSTFMSDSNVAAFRTAQTGEKQGTIYGAADVYVSDFGKIDVVPNRQWARVGATACRNAFLIDRDKLSKGWLRKIHTVKDVAVTSDGEPVVMIGEVSLIVKNEAACGVVADLNGFTSAS